VTADMEVSLDQRRCRGDCICELICPKIFVLDDEGIAHVTQGGTSLEGPSSWATVPAELEAQVMDAVAECPEQAIALR
jgi:ferredoxin